jgi:hypothetical protein
LYLLQKIRMHPLAQKSVMFLHQNIQECYDIPNIVKSISWKWQHLIGLQEIMLSLASNLSRAFTRNVRVLVFFG